VVRNSMPGIPGAAAIFLVTLLAVAIYMSHMVTMLTPNTPPPGDAGEGGCMECHGGETPHVRHCHICGRCTVLQEHHCFWVNNCVGAYNFKAHFLLLVYTIMFLVIVFVLLSGSIAHCGMRGNWQPFPTHYIGRMYIVDPYRFNMLAYCGVGDGIAVTVLVALIATPWLLLFTLRVLLGQLQRAVGTATTGPGKAPGSAPLEPGGRSVAACLFQANFGGGASLSWLLPFPTGEIFLEDGLPAYTRRETRELGATISGGLSPTHSSPLKRGYDLVQGLFSPGGGSGTPLSLSSPPRRKSFGLQGGMSPPSDRASRWGGAI